MTVSKLWRNAMKSSKIFVNLIKNGSEAIRDRYGQSLEGQITVNICQEVDTVLCTIEDNGTGILNDNIDLIFGSIFYHKICWSRYGSWSQHCLQAGA